jgi:hypothetical protein
MHLVFSYQNTLHFQIQKDWAWLLASLREDKVQKDLSILIGSYTQHQTQCLVLKQQSNKWISTDGTTLRLDMSQTQENKSSRNQS